jgi:hypothetical protein
MFIIIRSLLVLTLVLSLGVDNVNAFKLSIEIGNEEEFRLQSQTFLFGSYVNQRRVIDSVYSNNSVLFELSNSLPKGLYNIMIYTDMKDIEGKYQRLAFDVLIDGKDMEFIVEVKEDHTLGAVSARAGENRGYYDHFNESFNRKKRMEVVREIGEKYPPGDDFHLQLAAQAEKLLLEHQKATLSIGKAQIYPMAEFYFQTQKAVEAKTIENIDFRNPLLKHSQFIPMLIWEYMNADIDEKLSPASATQKLNNRFQTVFQKLKVDSEVHEIMLADMIKYYTKIGDHETVLYLNENFLLAEVCENQALTDKIKAKNESLKKMLVGEIAPNIEFGPSSAIKDLYTVEAGYTLLLFWESSCPHCKDVIKELSTIYNVNYKAEFEVVAISLDTVMAEYTAFVSANRLPWFNFADFEGWDGKNPVLYNVASTPSLFLLDRQKRIVAKPRSVNDIKAYFSTLKK